MDSSGLRAMRAVTVSDLRAQWIRMTDKLASEITKVTTATGAAAAAVVIRGKEEYEEGTKGEAHL